MQTLSSLILMGKKNIKEILLIFISTVILHEHVTILVARKFI